MAPTATDGDIPERVRAHLAPGTAAVVTALLDRWRIDLVHVEGYFLVQHLPRAPDVPVLLVAENVEYALERMREAVLGPTVPGWRATSEHERAAWRRATRCGAVSEDDAACMRADVPGLDVAWLPTGCDHVQDTSPAVRLPGRPVLYVGSAAWSPSNDATTFLIHQVWPTVLRDVPDAVLTIAGEGQDVASLGLGRLPPSVRLLGRVPSVGPLLGAADVVVCPVRFGGGVKAKMLEAVHAGCAVVSTSVGMQGMPSAVRDAVLVADTARGLAAHVAALLRDPMLAGRVRERVRLAARTLPTWDYAAERLDWLWRDLCGPARLKR